MTPAHLDSMGVGVPPTPVTLVSKGILEHTFELLRECGRGRHECQVLWIGPWSTPHLVTSAVHPVHQAHGAGFELADSWIPEFFGYLSETRQGIRAQVHTHPGRAFHSITDDNWPIVSTPGFLSLVIPTFAQGPMGFEGAFLAELGSEGAWRQVPCLSRIAIEDKRRDL